MGRALDPGYPSKSGQRHGSKFFMSYQHNGHLNRIEDDRQVRISPTSGENIAIIYDG
jgi:hypothetical protein